MLGIFVAVFAFFTFFWNYTNPPYLYWDENYHIASAQKYLNGTFFMEPHPPLGKMLIAAGEGLLDANPGADDEFIGTDYARELPEGFSFQGYRFFPALFGWAIAPLLYLVFLLITRKPIWAFVLSFLYVFDTALITHSRAAMLDSIMLFFCVGMIALYFLIREFKDHKHGFPLCSLLFGIAFGCAMATKALALIMVLLVPATILHMQKTKNKKQIANSKHSLWLSTLNSQLSTLNYKLVAQFITLSFCGFLITYIGIWQLHFSMGKNVIPSLPDQGYYQASDTYKSLIHGEQVDTMLMLSENVHFLSHYSRGVPKLNLCKADENGSPFYFWPFGARSINYRWETPDSFHYLYIQLVANPVIWGVALLSLFLAFALLVGSAILPIQGTLRYRNELLLWSGMWASYMIAVSQIDRVMYLYHYFIPLIFSFIVVAYVLLELQQLGKYKLTESKKSWFVLALGICIFASFEFYRPLSYYEPIDDTAFMQRSIFKLWDLNCVNCQRDSNLALPIGNES